MHYSINIDKKDLVLAQSYEINASYKDLGAVCDSIRYVRADSALELLDRFIEMKAAVPYKRHNKHMGSRSELQGAKGAYPIKAAREVRKTLVNAIANARNKGWEGEELVIVHASANKTHIERRYPSKGSISWGRGMYGRSALNHSDLEYAKIEIALSDSDSRGLTKNMKFHIKKLLKPVKAEPKEKAKVAKPVTAEKKEEPKKEEPKLLEKKEEPIAITQEKK